MTGNTSLARWCGIAGIAGMAVGVLSGVIGLINPDAYVPAPDVYAYSTSLGKLVALLVGVAVAGFTLAYLGFYFVGAVGDGLLGRVATILSAIGTGGTAIGLFHGTLVGAASPLVYLGYFALPGYILLTVAALQVKRVSTVAALVPLATMIAIAVIEFGLPNTGIFHILHEIAWGALSIVVLLAATGARARPV